MTCSSCVVDLSSELDDAFSKYVFLHRALLKDDMIELFSDPSMINVNLDVTVIGNDGNPEEGTGLSGCNEGSIDQLLATSLPFTNSWNTGKSAMHKA